MNLGHVDLRKRFLVGGSVERGLKVLSWWQAAVEESPPGLAVLRGDLGPGVCEQGDALKQGVNVFEVVAVVPVSLVSGVQ
jgi:hypothetical protein